MKTLNVIRNRRAGGFTLMELMLVLGIITLLTVVALRIGPSVNKSGRIAVSRTGVGHLAGIVSTYQNTHGGRLPQNLQVLVEKGTVEEAVINDPWGNRYQFVVPSKRSKEKFDLYSMGPDEIDGNQDDVGNWPDE